MNTTTLVWIRNAAGSYRSECGRFTIVKAPSHQLMRNPWYLTDTTRTECDGKTEWSRHYHSLDFAKRNAQRVAETGRVIGESRPLIDIL